MSSGAVCAACRRTIDAAAKICPYCGANPATGERVDTQAILQEIFHTKDLSATESVVEYARQRQGWVVGGAVLIVFLLLAGVHAFVTRQNESMVSDAPPVPLTELTDLANKPNESAPAPMPPLEFSYDGRAQRMRTYIVERGATTPPEVLAAQAAPNPPAASPASPQQVPPQQVPPRPPQSR